MENILNYFKLLSDETRLRILMLLYTRELCVCQLTGITGVSQPNISKHLGKLKEKNLVKDRREEQYVFYSLKTEDPLFLKILGDIFRDLENYPVLKSDNEKSLAAAY